MKHRGKGVEGSREGRGTTQGCVADKNNKIYGVQSIELTRTEHIVVMAQP